MPAWLAPTPFKLPRRRKAAKSLPHHLTGVDKLHKAGIRGKGVKVAIIDTGIDYTHKALGGCFGPRCKVVGGYDLVGSDWDAELGEGLPDDDPMDSVGHGTWVAGIVAADSEHYVGVAPDAQLLAFKVSTDQGDFGGGPVMIQAFCDAYSAGADVISISLGLKGSFSDGPLATVARRIVQRGVVVVAAQGNDGTWGPFSTTSIANGHGVLAVAAVNTNAGSDARAADFTSWGPTADLLLKPDIGAPGVEIAGPDLRQSYSFNSGTSASAPYIAGIAALYLGKHGGRKVHGPGIALRLARRISSSGRSVGWQSRHASDALAMAPPFQVGTGLIDAPKVLKYTTQLSSEPFALRDTESFRAGWTMNVSNLGSRPVHYTFWLEPQAGVAMSPAVGFEGERASAFQHGYGLVFNETPLAIVPGVQLPAPLTIGPGQAKTVNLTFSPPRVAAAHLLPLYGGKVWVSGDNGEELCVPYGGVAYKTREAFSRMLSPATSVGRLGKTTRSWTFTHGAAVSPLEILVDLPYGCEQLRWDIFEGEWSEQSWTFPPRVGDKGYVGAAVMREYFAFMRKHRFPKFKVTRGPSLYTWHGKLTDGTQLGPGNYTVRFAALRPSGDPRRSDDWDVFPLDVPFVRVLPGGARGAGSTATAAHARG